MFIMFIIILYDKNELLNSKRLIIRIPYIFFLTPSLLISHLRQ